MRLFVTNPQTQTKEYLTFQAASRHELAQIIGSPWFTLNGNRYHVHQVVAEANSNNIATGAAIGAAIGLLAGPLGILIGGALGGALGNEGDKPENAQINSFNQSSI